ncbi:MAG: STAS domain-containing protein [Anaerolineaceae bacterium]|nr:STAS domain-containing protein [Anaerolineaceae bacterium]
MEIKTSEFKHCDLITLSGRLDSSTALSLEKTINEILENGRYNIVVNIKDLDFISSAGLRVLINTQKTCKKLLNPGEVVLAEVPINIMEAFDLAGFTVLFKFFDDTLHAVGHF